MSRKRKSRKVKSRNESEFKIPRKVSYVHWTQISGRKTNIGPFDPLKVHVDSERMILGGRRK